MPARRWSTRTDLYERLDDAKVYLDQCVLDSGSLEEASNVAGLSKHHFIRLFHEVHGITPYQYLTARKLKVAEQMLASEALTIAEISCALGFVSQSAFGRLFKKHSGLTPSAFRRAASPN